MSRCTYRLEFFPSFKGRLWNQLVVADRIERPTQDAGQDGGGSLVDADLVFENDGQIA